MKYKLLELKMLAMINVRNLYWSLMIMSFKSSINRNSAQR